MRSPMRNIQAGFTLLELLIVIAIIGLLATIIFSSMNRSREQANAGKAIAEIRELTKLVLLYYDDTGEFPATCRETCTAASDPFLNPLGIPGWSGPYFTMYNFTHPWKGQFGYQKGTYPAGVSDWDGDGTTDYGIVLNDDSPGSTNNNDGLVPGSALRRIDRVLDDGVLTTGLVRGNETSSNFQCWTNQTCSPGEMIVKINLQ
jgi:general secretion pathway protein G